MICPKCLKCILRPVIWFDVHKNDDKEYMICDNCGYEEQIS
jgi:transcription elongation factor Elf1